LPATASLRTDAAGTTPADPGFPGSTAAGVRAFQPGDRVGGTDTAASKASKRMKAQEGTRWRAVATCRAIGNHLTDQGLEGDGLDFGPVHRQRCDRAECEDERQGGTGAGDRVAAVRWRCPSRGGSACGERSRDWETDFTIRNAANPRAGCRVQQTCEPSRGENRRGGEKPRGRNETSRLVASRPKVAPVTGSGCAADVSAEGRGQVSGE